MSWYELFSDTKFMMAILFFCLLCHLQCCSFLHASVYSTCSNFHLLLCQLLRRFYHIMKSLGFAKLYVHVIFNVFLFPLFWVELPCLSP